MASIFQPDFAGGWNTTTGYPLAQASNYPLFGVGAYVDVKLTKRISLRAVDFEYQYWPLWGNSSLSPYGASMGIGYRVF